MGRGSVLFGGFLAAGNWMVQSVIFLFTNLTG